MRRRTRIFFKHTAWLACRWTALPVALLALRLAWGMEASNRLTATRRSLHVQGLPTSRADLPDPSRVPPDQDAVAPFLSAVSKYKPTSDQLSIIDSPDPKYISETHKFTLKEATDLKAIWQEKLPCIADLDVAASRSQYAWSTDVTTFIGSGSNFSLGETRSLSNFLYDMAVISADDHQDAQALHNLRLIFTLARVVDHQNILISHLVAVAIRSVATNGIDRVLPQVKLQNPEVVAEARLLLADTLEASEPSDFSKSWEGEFVYLDLGVQKYRDQSTWWISPLFDDDQSDALASDFRQLAAARATSYPQAKSRVIPAPPSPKLRLPLVLRPFSYDSFTTLDRLSLLHCRSLASVRACDILLAAQMYAQARGQFPKNATDLVPQYLTELPIDPFDAAGKPVHYRLDTEGPTVWSVGENGTDELGQPLPVGSTSRFRNHPDIIFGAAWQKFIASLPP